MPPRTRNASPTHSVTRNARFKRPLLRYDFIVCAVPTLEQIFVKHGYTRQWSVDRVRRINLTAKHELVVSHVIQCLWTVEVGVALMNSNFNLHMDL